MVTKGSEYLGTSSRSEMPLCPDKLFHSLSGAVSWFGDHSHLLDLRGVQSVGTGTYLSNDGANLNAFFRHWSGRTDARFIYRLSPAVRQEFRMDRAEC